MLNLVGLVGMFVIGGGFDLFRNFGFALPVLPALSDGEFDWFEPVVPVFVESFVT